MAWEIDYQAGRPAGYTDDLGIIADSNQWVKEMPSGWYAWYRDWPSGLENSSIRDIEVWCEVNCQGHWDRTGYNFYFTRRQDATLFKMVWS